MFGMLKNVMGRMVGARAGLLLAPVALASLAGAAHASDPWDHDRWDRWHRHDVVVWRQPAVVIGPRVVIGAPPPVVVAQPTVVVAPSPDVVPSDVHFAAFQTRDTVLILVSGANAGNGYSTSLTSADCSGLSPTLQMRNCPPNGAVIGGVSTPFTLNAAIHVAHAISTVNVVVAGQTYQVPVTDVQSLS